MKYFLNLTLVNKTLKLSMIRFLHVIVKIDRARAETMLMNCNFSACPPN